MQVADSSQDPVIPDRQAGNTVAGDSTAPRGSGRGGAEVSPAAKLTGFLILLVVVFIAAYAAGTHVGPVTTGHPEPGQPMHMMHMKNGQPMHMNMGTP